MKPMLCQKLTPAEAKVFCASNSVIIQRKYDGVRAYVLNGVLYDRRGADITKRFPELVLPNLPNAIDGELLASSGKFEDTAGRMHMKNKFDIVLLSKRNPVLFYAFDYVIEDMPLSARLGLLRGLQLDKCFVVAPEWDGVEFERLWAEVLEKGEEGLVVKQSQSLYRDGLRSPEWLKVKSFEETTAVFTKFEDHPKGITVETADGRRVNINGEQAYAVRKILVEKGSVSAEIQFLPQKESAAWRFPSFKRVCGDV